MDGLTDAFGPGRETDFPIDIPDIRPDTSGFINPFNDKRWLNYFSKLLPRFKYVRMLGLPHLKDLPDVLIERLYVPPAMAETYVAGDKVEDTESFSIEQILDSHRRLVVLGDPGAGKSTLINYLTTVLASSRKHAFTSSLGRMIPMPFILRDYSISKNISFDSLLGQFRTQPFWPKKKGPSTEDLQQALTSGQALIMLDGLDEVGDVDRRKALRKAVWEGIRNFPSCIWLLTSRIIGYDDVPFHSHSKPMALRQNDALSVLNSIGIQKVFHILPFKMKLIHSFIEKWYTLRESDKTIREDSIASLKKAVKDSQSILHLARNPNMLTLIALIHRVYAKLPSGRVMLYDKITEAYLESIDDYRGIRETAVSRKQHVLWLSQLAYAMQKKREEKQTDESDILIAEDKVKEMMTNTLGPAVDIDRELSYIARRSGLLLPRKPGYYNFVHLSFQEYFAALYLYEGLISFDRRQTFEEIIPELAKNKAWHECLVLLFEKLSEHPGASDSIFNLLFKCLTDPCVPAAELAVQLLSDLHSGLGPDNQKKAAQMILNTMDQNNSFSLPAMIDHLSDDTWTQIFLPELKQFLKDLKAKCSPPSRNMLINLQNLNKLDLKDLEKLIKQTVLNMISSEDLFFLRPLLYESDGPMFNEIISRMPLRDWFSSYWSCSSPSLILTNNRFTWRFSNKSDFLTWCQTIKLFHDLLFVKNILLIRNNNKWDQALKNSLEKVRDRNLNRKQDRNQEKFLSRYVMISKNMYLPRSLEIALYLAQNEYRDRNQDRDLPLVLKHTLDLTLALDPKNCVFSTHFFVAIEILNGNDDLVIPDMGADPAAKKPLYLIFFHLARLLAGRGRKTDWEIIEQQTAIVRDPEWIKQNLPYTTAREINETFPLLGLPTDGGKGLFEAEWFDDGHALAPFLNSKPSEFVAAVKNLTKQHLDAGQKNQSLT